MAFMWTKGWNVSSSIINSHRATLVQQGRLKMIWSWGKSSLGGFVRQVHTMANSHSTLKTRPRHLILYGMAAFLWEREKIPEEEVQRCLRYYEDRASACAGDRSLSPSSTTSRSSWFSWFNRQPDEETVTIKPSSPPLPVDEEELKRQQFVSELTTLYSEHSHEQMSKYPLVGMKRKVSVGYKIGSSVVKKTKASVASLVKHAAALSQTAANESRTSDFTPVCLSCCESISDLACIEAEVHSHHWHLVGDWVPVAIDAEPTNQFQASGYPLVGLQERRSKVVEKLSQVDLPSLRNSLENFMHTFDQTVGMDSILDHSVVVQANIVLRTFFKQTIEVLSNFVQEHSFTNIGSSSSEPKMSNNEFLSDWELFVNEPSYLVYRKPYADTGLYQFKVIGTYSDVTAKDFYEVQVDEKLRMSWDHYVTKLSTVDFDPNSGCEVVHWVMKFPFPMASREYVYVHKSWISPKDDAIVFVNRSVTHPSISESDSAVRVKDYYSEMVIKAHTYISEPGLNYELTYFDDPQVHLPSSCINWVANSALPEFLGKVHKAALTRQATQGPVGLAT